MRKLAVVAFLVLSLIAAAIGVVQAQTPVAQENAAGPISTELAPPSSEEIPGASLDIISDTTSDSGAAGMTLYRITLEPGVEVPEHWHSGSVTWFVDSGTLAFTVTSGEVWVRCANCASDATPDDSGFVLVPEGTEVVLEPGDWVIQHDTTAHAYRNAGDDNVVIDASTTYSLEETSAAGTEVTTQGGGGATPAAGRRIKPQGCGGGCY